VTPNNVSYPPCANRTQRPFVVAVVTDPDNRPAELRVELQYAFGAGGDGDGYDGGGRMTYDAGRKAFTYRLPAFEYRHAKGEAGHVNVSVQAQDPSGGPDPRPRSTYVSVNSCIIVGNG
jgi:hypothetical protein